MDTHPFAHLTKPRPRNGVGLAAVLSCTLLQGCSLFSPMPLWELVKATGALASSAISVAPAQATRTVLHGRNRVQNVCIEFNQAGQLIDLVPALQNELKAHAVDSRVYGNGVQVSECEVWLRYTASIEWGLPPLATDYRAYLDSATLAMHDRQGRLLATSSYEIDATFGMGRWADTRSKLAPVVAALLDDNPGTTSSRQDHGETP
jgi:hypothetical protein